MNRIIIKGRVANVPELKTTQMGKEVCNFDVAVSRRYDKENTDFFSVAAWGQMGVFVSSYFQKGQEILVSGTMQCRRWQDEEGNNRYTWGIIADEIDFCGSRHTDTSKTEAVPVDVDEELPF